TFIGCSFYISLLLTYLFLTVNLLAIEVNFSKALNATIMSSQYIRETNTPKTAINTPLIIVNKPPKKAPLNTENIVANPLKKKMIPQSREAATPIKNKILIMVGGIITSTVKYFFICIPPSIM